MRVFPTKIVAEKEEEAYGEFSPSALPPLPLQPNPCDYKHVVSLPYTHCQSAGLVPLKTDFPAPTVAPTADPAFAGSRHRLKYQRPCWRRRRSRRRPTRTKWEARPAGSIVSVQKRKNQSGRYLTVAEKFTTLITRCVRYVQMRSRDCAIAVRPDSYWSYSLP